ncbi:MAG: ATP-binding cassette domain-containing protein [Pseudacidovorax sp.]|nr:ATP-binding cassette domain-containing protein [Pseudacidovorax sp.]
MALIDIDLQLAVSDGQRRFELRICFGSDARMVALYGPSGAGKSLTLQAVAGLLRPARGHVRIGGRTLFDAGAGIDLPTQQRRVGYLFQHYALFPHLSVRQNIGFGLTTWWRRRLDARAAQRVDELLAGFGLESMANARPAALSGGQQQRVALARALACEPQLLLLDEPFAALNPMLRHDLRQELAAVCARWQLPVLMITHDVDDVLALAEEAVLIEQGRAVRQVDVARGTGVELQLAGGAARAAEPPQAAAVRRLLGAAHG